MAPGRDPASLEHAIGLTSVPPQGVRVTFEVNGLSGSAGTAATFTVTFEFAPAPYRVAEAAQPAPPAGVAPVPRYTYGPGYNGYGDNESVSPATARPRTTDHRTYGSAMRFPAAGHEVGPNHRDWGSGRDVRLAKPWMQPFDD